MRAQPAGGREQHPHRAGSHHDMVRGTDHRRADRAPEGDGSEAQDSAGVDRDETGRQILQVEGKRRSGPQPGVTRVGGLDERGVGYVPAGRGADPPPASRLLDLRARHRRHQQRTAGEAEYPVRRRHHVHRFALHGDGHQLKVIAAVVTGVRPVPPEVVKVRAPAAPVTLRPVKLTAPLASVNPMTVPLRVPPPDAMEMASGRPASATLAPAEFRSCTVMVKLVPRVSGPAGALVMPIWVADCAVKVTGLPVMLAPVTVASSVLGAVAPRVQLPTGASPSASVSWFAPVIDPPPDCTLNVTTGRLRGCRWRRSP